jgi:CubicO group peptidase (beta-lactamase class C family)
MAQKEVRKIKNRDTLRFSIDEYLSTSATTAFLLIKNDTIVFEKYYQGYDRSKISTFFSVTKSITSLLVGIAIDEGHIKSIHDPVTDYIPEFKKGDSRFEKLTIEHLLNMQAGLRFNESYKNFFSGMAKLFYGRNSFGQLKKLKFDIEPGVENEYNSATTAILGIVLERAVKKSYTEYLKEKVWEPLGMEYNASMSLDDKKHRVAKAYQGLNATAVDLAKIGRLYLNGGNWNGKQIVSKEWIEKSTTPDIEESHTGVKYKGYQYQWYSESRTVRDSTGNYQFNDSITALRIAEELAGEHFKLWHLRNNRKSDRHWEVYKYLPQYYAFGLMNQILWIDAEKKIIMVRLGKYAENAFGSIALTRNILTWEYPIIEKSYTE